MLPSTPDPTGQSPCPSGPPSPASEGGPDSVRLVDYFEVGPRGSIPLVSFAPDDLVWHRRPSPLAAKALESAGVIRRLEAMLQRPPLVIDSPPGATFVPARPEVERAFVTPNPPAPG